MDFIDDDGLDATEEIHDQLLLGLEHQKEAFRRRDKDFRTGCPNFLSFRRRGIAAADGDSGGWQGKSFLRGQFTDFRQRRQQIFADVVVKRLQWRNIDGGKLL